MATIDTKNMVIENGRISGVLITDSFSSQCDKGGNAQFNNTWEVDLPIEKVLELFWGDCKVKMRSANLRKMTLAETEELRGKELKVEDYLTATPTAGKVERLTQQVEAQRNAMVKMLMEAAMTEIIAENPDEKDTEVLQNLSRQRFEEKYAPQIDAIS